MSTGASSASPVSHLLDSPAASPRLPFLSRSSLSATSVVSNQGGVNSGCDTTTTTSTTTSLKSTSGGDGQQRVSFTVDFDDSDDSLLSTSNNNNNNGGGGVDNGNDGLTGDTRNNNNSGNNSIIIPVGDKSMGSSYNSSGSLKLPRTPPTTTNVVSGDIQRQISSNSDIPSSSSSSSLTSYNDLNKIGSASTSAVVATSLPSISSSYPATSNSATLTKTSTKPEPCIGDYKRLPSLLSTPNSKGTPTHAGGELRSTPLSSSSSSYKSATEDQTLPRFAISIEDGPKSPINLKELSPGKTHGGDLSL